MERRGILVAGQVQGVGFRPFVYRMAKRLGLTGQVGNTSQGVRIEVQGESENLDAFIRALHHDLPPLARISSLREERMPPAEQEKDFVIAPSQGQHGHGVLISPDVATCDACLHELFEPADRRYLYPFINCTDCGPRYTITRSIPYDRATTTMGCFPLCPECAAEYGNPEQRRFHAQPNACPVCGPRLWFVRAGDKHTKPSARPDNQDLLAPLQQSATALARGEIVAVKGLGGFHLACNACDEAAIARLRQRKMRPHKALAVMVPDLKAARSVAHISEAEGAVLQSRERPIVIVPRRGAPLPAAIAPDLLSVGLMLPSTPLHHVLLHLFAMHTDGPPALVMTSGNAHGEPIIRGNREALARLGGIADCFLLHDRDILVRADDSVLCLTPENDEKLFFRRARGFVPSPLRLEKDGACVLALGAELKNTFCLTKDRDAFVSQHIGDLEDMETQACSRQAIAHLGALLEVKPEVAVCDLHPNYASTRYAEESGLPVLRLQHHFAHIHAVLAEHGHAGPALGLALDGTGFGDDGTVWGGELLLVHPDEARATPAAFGLPTPDPSQQRLGRLAPFPLPGGEAAIREPWRIACALAMQTGLDPHQIPLPDPMRNEATRAAIIHLAHKGVQRTSSCGRLFDAVSALLGLCGQTTYEGQAAIRLEQHQDMTEKQGLSCRLTDNNGLLELDVADLFFQIAQMRRTKMETPTLARRFHRGLIDGLAALAAAGAEQSALTIVALSGGVLQNLTVRRELPGALRQRGLTPLVHRSLPPGDGGLSLGQAVWARHCLRNL